MDSPRDNGVMDRFKKMLQRRTDYEPLEGGSERPDGERIEPSKEAAFSWVDYSIFMLLGVAMLWAWNMFLAAGPYFQRRFSSNEDILANFQSAELSVSTVANLGSMLLLTKLQAKANYPKRIIASLAINIVTFTLLAISTRLFLGVSAGVYFGFLVVVVFLSSLATGLCQNGVFAYVGGLGREEYTQGIMTGQGIAGVLPCIVQIASVLSVPLKKEGDVPEESSKSAFAYFLTATGVSAITLVAFVLLLSRHGLRQSHKQHIEAIDSETDDPSTPEHKTIPLLRLFSKLFWMAGAIFLTFCITMMFPVFTQKILSVSTPVPPNTAAPIWQPSAFIPLAFLFWNVGDLVGRLLTAIPRVSLTGYPKLLFGLAVARIIFIPLYFLCNIRGKGAYIDSDFFYLCVVQLLFGFSNGYVGSSCMMGFVEWVDEEEREAAGGFMGLCLVGGLAVGSILSFFVAGG